ncbi:MAG: hypothetical protein HY236_07315 [Acidobacteria bacterium]|nr:hypothetical protein [Acidobacteriota bacterium]
MRKLFVLSGLLAAFALAAAAGEWQGYLMDTMCAAKMKDKAASHKAQCALSCSKGGYGIVTADGKYVKFDEAGNVKALGALKATTKDQELMVKVTGSLDRDLIKVDSITIQ